MRRAIEPDNSHTMFHPANQRAQNSIEVIVILDMIPARSAGLHANRQRQRLRIRIRIERQPLRHAIIGEREIVAVRLKTTSPFFVFTRAGTSTTVERTVSVGPADRSAVRDAFTAAKNKSRTPALITQA